MHILAFFIFFYFVSIAFCKVEYRNKVSWLLSMSLVMIIHVFIDSHNVPDLPGYIEAWQHIAKGKSTFESASGYYKMFYGYYWLNLLLSGISGSVYFFKLVIGLIISLPNYILFYKFCKKNLLIPSSIYLISCTQSMFALRQYCAVSMCIIISIILVKDVENTRKWLCSVLLFVYACLLHPTALFFGLAFILYIFRNSKLIILMFFPVFSLMVYILYPIIVVSFSENVSGYEIYAMKEGVKNSTTSMIFCLTIFTYLFFLYFDRKRKYKNKKKMVVYMLSQTRIKLLIIQILKLLKKKSCKLSFVNSLNIICDNKYIFAPKNMEEFWFVGLYSIGGAFMIPFIWLPGDDVLPRLLLYYSFAAPLVYVYIGNHIYNKVLRFVYYTLVIALYIYLPFFGANSRIVDYSLSI